MKKKLGILSMVAIIGAGGALIPLRYSAVQSEGGFAINGAEAKAKRLSAREQRVFRKRINERLHRLEQLTFGRNGRVSTQNRSNNSNTNNSNNSSNNNSNNDNNSNNGGNSNNSNNSGN